MGRSNTIARIAMLACGLLTASVLAVEPQTAPPTIDIARAPAPLFDDPQWHGATDPFVIWNPVKGLWYLYYTQRRATLEDVHGVDWVHGSAIVKLTPEPEPRAPRFFGDHRRWLIADVSADFRRLSGC